MTDYYRNEALFSEIYLEEITRQPEQADVLSSLRVLREYRDYADTASLAAWTQSYVHEVLAALGFYAQAQRPGLSLLHPIGSADKAVSLCIVTLPGEDLDETVLGRNQAEKTIRALREQNMQWGLLTNGKTWRIYHLDESMPYETYLEMDLEQVLSDQAKEAYQIFYKFLKADNFAVGEDGKCQFDRFKQDSKNKIDYIEKELAKALKPNEEGGKGVLSGLCMGYVEEIRALGGEGDLDDESVRRKIYHGAMLYMFRLLFLFYAEARGLLSDENEVLLSTVKADATALHNGETLMGGAFALWERLSAIFVDIDQTYNGGLFSPQESEFTRFIEETRVADRYLAETLFNLTTYREKNGQERPISYRDMSVRHLGTLYEGLLEHKLFITAEATEVRITKGKIEFIPASQGGKLIKGQSLPAGAVYFAGDPSERKSTGSYYTPEYIVDYIVRNTVGEKLQALQADFLAQEAANLQALAHAVDADERAGLAGLLEANAVQFVREKVLALSVLDPAMGSGHFLVNATNLIANFITDFLNGLGINGASESGTAHWRRWVVENCIYGVDLNPLAVELAKLALWILSMAQEQPLSFMNHHLKCGNSLVGARLDEIGNYPSASAKKPARQSNMFERDPNFRAAVEDALAKARLIASHASTTLADVDEKKAWLAEIEQDLQGYKAICNVHTGLYFGNQVDEKEYTRLVEKRDFAGAFALEKPDKYFHWELEFPKIFLSSNANGFDCAIGNPPYGADIDFKFLDYLLKNYETPSNKPDTFLLFYERSMKLLEIKGVCGMVIPNTWLSNLAAGKFRSYLFENFSLKTIVHYKWQVFADATISVQNVITSNQLPTAEHTIQVKVLDKFDKIDGQVYRIQQKRWQISKGSPLNIFEHPDFTELIDRLRGLPRLDEVCTVTQGAKPFQVGKGKPRQTQEILDEKPYVSEIKKDETFRPLLRGSLMGRYKNLWHENYWISLGDWLAEPRYSANYDAQEKIVIRQTGDSLIATIDREQFVVRDNLYVIFSKNASCDLRYILAILNSKLLNWFYQKSLNPETNEPLAQVKRVHILQLPIVQPIIALNKFPNTYNSLIEATDLLLNMNKDLLNNPNDIKLAAEIKKVENLIDKYIYEIYNVSDEEAKLIF